MLEVIIRIAEAVIEELKKQKQQCDSPLTVAVITVFRQLWYKFVKPKRKIKFRYYS